MLGTPESKAPGYNGLTEQWAGLPADAYFDPRHHARELQRIWYRNWVYVCRSSDIAAARAFQTFELGDQKILLVRDDAGVLQGFHNTCRHRGAALCLGRTYLTGINQAEPLNAPSLDLVRK